MVDIQCAAAEIRRGKKKEEDRKKPQDENIMVALFHRATIKMIAYVITVILFLSLLNVMLCCK